MSDIIFTHKFTNFSTLGLLGWWAFDGEWCRKTIIGKNSIFSKRESIFGKKRN